MPPRKATVKRNKPSSTSATTPNVADRQLLAPEAKMETKLTADLKVNETVPAKSVQVEVSDPNGQTVGGDGVVKEDLRSAVDGGTQVVAETKVMQEKEDLPESKNADGEKQGEEGTEMNSAQEEMPAPQVDDSKTRNDNNNDVPDPDISRSLSKNNVAPVNSGDIEGITETVSIQDSVKYEFLENMDSDATDDSEGDDAEEDEDEDEDEAPSLIVQDSSPDDKKEKGTELYVGKLDKSAVEDDLVSVFQRFGELVSTRVVRKPNSDKSKGFGFVRFASVDQAKRALAELKDGVEVKGKRVVISASEDNDTLFLGNICKTWTKEHVLEQLKEYGIDNFEMIRLPEDTRVKDKNKGFAFLEFSTHSDAVAAFQRLKKPDVIFGRDESAKVAFAETTRDDDQLHVNRVYLEGLIKEDWNEEKVKDLCKKYGEILNVNLHLSSRPRKKSFGFVTFSSSESALACVEGINNTASEGEAKINASIAKPQEKVQTRKQGIRGGYKVVEGKISQPKSSKMKGVMNTRQTKTNPSKNKQEGFPKKDGDSSKEADTSKLHGEQGFQQGAKRKRKTSFGQKSNARDLSARKKPKNVGQGETSHPISQTGKRKRKNEVNEDRGNRKAQGKKPFKKQKGNLRGRDRDNFRKPKNDMRTRRGHDDYRSAANPYAPTYAATAPSAYHMDHSRQYSEMAPHAGYIEPASANQSRPYSGYVQPVVRTQGHHQAVYPQPALTNQSHLYTRYVDRPVITTQSHRGYIQPASDPYRDYRSSAVARDPYDSGLPRRAGVTYVEGPPPASHVPERTSYYQAGGSYRGAYGSRGGAYY